MKEQSVQDEERVAVLKATRKTRERAVAKFLMRESSRAQSADLRAREFANSFKVTREIGGCKLDIQFYCRSCLWIVQHATTNDVQQQLLLTFINVNLFVVSLEQKKK